MKLVSLLFLFILLVCIAPLFSHDIALPTYDFSWRGYVTIIIFILTFVLLAFEVFPPDLTLVFGSTLLVVAGVVKPEEFVLGFANEVLVTIAMLFIIVKTLEVNGVLNFIVRRLMPKSKTYALQICKLGIPLAGLSAFINNTPVVLMMTSVVRKWALKNNIYPSKYLIPISYVTILGGSCTLIGTSTNLVVDGMYRRIGDGRGIGFFDFAIVALPCAIVGFLYLIYIGKYLLPKRKDVYKEATKELYSFVNALVVSETSPLIGKSIAEIYNHFFHGFLRLIEIIRDDKVIFASNTGEILQKGDKLIILADAEELVDIQAMKGLVLVSNEHFNIDYEDSHFSEAIVSVGSSLIGKTARKARFKEKFNATILAVFRQGEIIMKNPSYISFRPGDALILLAETNWKIDLTFREDLHLIADSTQKLSFFNPLKSIILVGMLVLMIIASAIGVPIMISTLVVSTVYLLSKQISINDARKSIHWDLLILIGSAFAMGRALLTSGVADLFAQNFLKIISNNPYIFIAGIMLFTAIVTELITNNAAALLLFPIAFKAKEVAGFQSDTATKAVAIAVALAAAYSFVTPIGYQTNTIVYGPGGYKFTDYCKIGLPLTLLMLIISVLIIPTVWPLR